MREDPEFSSHAAADLSPHIRSFIGVPVVLASGAFYGTLCAVDPEPQKALTRQQADLMAVLARLLATQIERQRAEEALRESQEALRQSEEFHRFAVEAGRIGTWDLDLRTEECLISPKMAELMGFPPDQTTVPGSRWREAIVPDDREPMASALAASIESDAPFDLKFRVALKDGTERWLYSRGGASRDASGKALHVHGASIDVTERKRAEEAIRESGRRIENILESITEEFFAVDREWRYAYINERALRRIRRVKGERLTREELLGRNVWEVYPELVGSSVYRELHRALREQKPAGFEALSPLSDRWFEIHAYPSEEGLAVYGQDITERKRAEEALAREVRAKSDFLADVSHELRTPLTVIRGNAEVGLELGRGWAHADLLEEIVEESAMMSRMVEDLLFLARSDSDSLPLDLRTVPVSQLLGGLAKRAETLAREYGASLRVGLGGEGHLRCNAGRIEQAVLVLIDNAAKYGPPGGQVTLSSSTRTGELLIEAADRGPGIPPEELPRVFERFYRCKNSTGEPGSGLGLPIAKTIVKGHGGRIEAASEVGEGTRVSLRLPLINGI